MAGLPPLHGHEDVRLRLARAVRAGELPGSLLLYGPPGVGRQRFGHWLAQRMVCEAPGEIEPCDQCRSCRLAIGLQHPDVHWFFPLVRPKGVSGPEKLADALEDARAAELAAYRTDPFRPVGPSEPTGIYLAQVQTLRRIAAAAPAMGRCKVFLVGDAEQLVPQESSPEAANALLKVLEEPSPHTTFILTAREPESLLPTIRSRLLPVRLRPLPFDDVLGFLLRKRGVPEPAARIAAGLAQGSIGRALAFLPVEDGAPSAAEQLRQQARRLLEAAAAADPRPRLAAAHALPAAGARGAFRDTLDFLALWIRDLAATAAGAPDRVVNTDADTLLADLARRLPGAGPGMPAALAAVEEARGLAAGNVNPQLTAAWLLDAIRAALTRQS